ncbi:MAG: hypothetical protein ABSH32_08320 [Bryobacteraceae bacterium]
MEYLAGRIDRTEYERYVPAEWLQQLRLNLESGNGISGVSISRSPDRDDDGLLITSGDRDAAMSPFRPGPANDAPEAV